MIIVAIKCKDCTFEASVDKLGSSYTAKVIKLPQKTVVWSFETSRLFEARSLAEDACRSFAANYSYTS